MINLSSEGMFYTIQGEGEYTGYPTIFCRTSGCNLRCAWENSNGEITYCDTPHTSFHPEINKCHPDQLIKEIHDYNVKHVCISGGEPYLQTGIVKVINTLHKLGHFVSLETNGTIYRSSLADYISISPKLKSSAASAPHADMHNKKRLNYDALENFICNHKYQFKFVLNDMADVREIIDIKDNLFLRTGIDINDNIWLMPQGISNQQFDSKLPMMADICKEYNWKLSDRLHIRIWGNKKDT